MDILKTISDIFSNKSEDKSIPAGTSSFLGKNTQKAVNSIPFLANKTPLGQTKEQTTSILSKKPSSSASMEFKVGEGLTPEQTDTAITKIANPDTAFKEGAKKTITGIFKNEFSVRETPVEVRPLFAKTPIETKAPPIVTQLGGIGNYLAELLPKVVSQTVANFSTSQKSTLPFGLDKRRIGLEGEGSEVESTGSRMIADFDTRMAESPTTPKLNILFSSLIPVTDTLDAFGAGDIVTSFAKQGLKVTKFDKVLTDSLSKVGLNYENASIQNLKEQFSKRAQDLIRAGDMQGLNELGSATQYIAQKITGEGIPKLNKLGEFVQNISKNLLKDLGVDDVIVRPLGYEAQKGLPGTREVPNQAPNFGLSVKTVEDVGGNNLSKEQAKAEITNIFKKATATDTNVATKTKAKQVSKTFEPNDVIEITDKATGKSQKRIVKRQLEDNSGLVVIDEVSGIPRTMPFDKWDIKLLEKGDANKPLPAKGITFKETAEMEEVDELTKEAKKYKTSEEFENALPSIIGNQKGRDMGLGAGVFDNIKGTPISESDEMITVYRGVSKGQENKIVNGDYVSLSKKDASSFGDEVQSFEVPKNKLREATSIDALIYGEGKTKSQLIDIWNNAKSKEVKISNEKYPFEIGGDEYNGQAIKKNGEVIGGIEIDRDLKVPEIKGFLIEDKYKRQGIGTEIISSLLKENPKIYVKSTPESLKFWKSVGLKDIKLNEDSGLYEGYLAKKAPVEAFKVKPKTNLFSRTIKITPEEARQAIKESLARNKISIDDVKLLFPEYEKGQGFLGSFRKNHVLYGDLIKLYQREGKIGLGTALHESKHLLISRMPDNLRNEIFDQAKKEITPMKRKMLEDAYRDMGSKYAGRNLEDGIIEEYIVDKWTRSDLKEFYGQGKTIWERAFEFLDNLLAKIVKVYKNISEWYKSIPNKQGGFIRVSNERKAVTEADKLIMEGKIRIISREGKDIYQYKKGGEWVTTLNEDTAVRQLTGEKTQKIAIAEAKLPQELQERGLMLEIKGDDIANNPLNRLWKYANKTDGTLPEVGGDNSIFGKTGDDITAREEFLRFGKNGEYPDTETIRNEFAKFVQEKREYKEDLKQFIRDKKEALREISSNQSPYVAKETKLPEEKKLISLQSNKDQENIDTDLRSLEENISYNESITQTIEDVNDSKYEFENFRTDPFADSVNVPIEQSIFDSITERAKEGNSMFKPQSGFSLNARDPFRNFEAFFGKDLFPEIKETFLDPLDTSKGEYIDTQNELADVLKAKTKELGIKINSEEDRAIMDYGERNLPDDLRPKNVETRDTLIAKFGIEKANKIIEADKFFREQYNTLIDRINVEKKKLYGDVWAKKKDMDSEIELLKKNIKEKSYQLEDKVNTETLAYNKLQNQITRLKKSLQNREELLKSDVWWRGKVIGKRNDYYRHYFELAEGFKALKNILTTDANISTNLAGISTQTKPKSKFLQFAQARTGNKSERSAIGGFLNYIPSASYAIHIDKNIEGFRKLADSLRASENKQYSPMIEFITDFANDLAGKTNEIDRGIQKVTGRKVFKAIDWINNRVKANTILGNVASSMAQIFNIPQGVASAKQHSIKGAVRSFAQIVQKNPAMEQSSFIKERFAKSITNQFDTAWINKPKQFSVWMLGALDEVGTKFIWNSHYEKAVAEKISNPIKYADDVTRKLVGGRGIGEVPLVQKSKIFQMIAPFQLEVGNSWWVMKDFVSKKDFSAVALFFVTAYVMNRVAEEVRGSDVVFDPIQAIIEGGQAFSQEENKFRGTAKLFGRVSGEVFSNIPLGQSLASLYPEYGYGKGDWNISREELFGKGDPTRFGGGLLAMKGLQDPLFKVLLPFGGGQVKKTIEGLKTIKEGATYDALGKLKFIQKQDPLSKVRAVLFGKSSSPEAQEYFDKKDTNIIQENPKIKKIYDNVQELKKNNQIDEAKAIVDELTDSEYEIYKKIKTYVTRDENAQARKDIYPIYTEVQKLKKDGNIEEAKAIIEGLTDDQYKAYEAVKKDIEKNGEESTKEISNKTIIQEVLTYAKAVGVDPATAFNRIFTGQKIKRVSNKTVIVERMSLEDSEKVKKDRGSTTNMRLDHTISLQLGGSNSEDNLKLVSLEEWASYTPVENYLGKALIAKKISKKEAQNLILKFKNKEISFEEIKNTVE